jgi:hypothetical protein
MFRLGSPNREYVPAWNWKQERGHSRSNVWQYAGVKSLCAGRLEELNVHPPVQPVALGADAEKDCARRGDVLDTLCGSGATILAAERTPGVAPMR